MADDDYDFFDDPIAEDSPKYNAFGNSKGDKIRTGDGESNGGGENSRFRSNSSDRNSPTSARSENHDRYSDSFTDESDVESDNGNKNVQRHKIEARVPSAAGSSKHDRNSSDTDSSPERSRSEDDNSISRHSDKRPETSKGQYKKSERKYSDDSFSETESLSASDADSDVTDVSPLHSPKRNYKQNGKPPKSPAYNSDSKSVRSTSDVYKDVFENNGDKMNLEILMQAVMEMENSRQNDDYSKNERIAKSRRVLFVPQKAIPPNRKNFSFSNDKVSVIDRENQRLMEKIVKFSAETKTKKKQTRNKIKSVPTKMTPSAVNRLKEQQRIERENIAMLTRLQKTTASRQMQRENLLMDYEKKTIAGQSVAAAHCQRESPYSMTMIHQRSYSTNDLGPDKASVTLKCRGKWSRPTSATTYQSGGMRDPATVTLESKRSRPVSASTLRSDGNGIKKAKYRPHSAHVGSTTYHDGKFHISSKRPDWDCRF